MLQAASLIFFSFAGYARIATLGEEVRDPRRTLPRAVVAALAIVLLLSAATAIVLLIGLGSERLGAERLAARRAGRPGLGCRGADRRGRRLRRLAARRARRAQPHESRDGARRRPAAAPSHRVAQRTATPVVADVVVAVVAIVAVLLLEPTVVVGVSACAVLGYYGIANASAFRQAKPARWLPRARAGARGARLRHPGAHGAVAGRRRGRRLSRRRAFRALPRRVAPEAPSRSVT